MLTVFDMELKFKDTCIYREKMLGMENHFDISDSIEIREVDIAGVACISLFSKLMKCQTVYESTTCLRQSSNYPHYFYIQCPLLTCSIHLCISVGKNSVSKIYWFAVFQTKYMSTGVVIVIQHILLVRFYVYAQALEVWSLNPLKCS